MATLAADSPRDFLEAEPLVKLRLPVVATDIIYAGAAVAESGSTGTIRPLVAADTFVGFAEEKVDNSAGAAADKDVQVRMKGVVRIPVAIVAGIADLGANVYASDDDTFTLSSGGNSIIGQICKYDTGTYCFVSFKADCLA